MSVRFISEVKNEYMQAPLTDKHNQAGANITSKLLA